MPMLGRVAACALALVLAASVARAADWSVYGNARFGYLVEIPPGFSAISDAENGDGGTSRSAQGHALLAVWGSNLLDESFAASAASRIASASADGWTIVFKSVGRGGASWSGTRGDRLLYAHAIPRCYDQAAFLEIEYDASARAAFDPVVTRLARSLKTSGRC